MPKSADWQRHLERDPLAPLYAIVSSDSYMRAEAVDTLRRRVLTRAADFNRDELAAPRITAAQIIAAANTFPMMAPLRWVHVADIHKLPAAEGAALLKYIAAPASGTVLCLSGEKIDGRTKLGVALRNAGALLALEPPRPADLPMWIKGRADRLKIPVQDDAASLLAELIGPELGTLLRSLEKLALFAGADASITVEHVEAVIAATRVSSIFELTDALGRRDWIGASILLRNIIDGGESPLVVLTMLTRQLRQLLKVKTLEERGVRASEMAQSLGIRPYLIDALRQSARRYSNAELCAALVNSTEVDRKLKSGGLENWAVLEGMLLEVMGHRRAS